MSFNTSTSACKEKRSLDNDSESLFRSCKTHFIFGEKCTNCSALYYVNALHVFLGFSFHCVLKLNLK